ncbi:hypothetical protein DV736_g4087, partial [Chaetothyriales sp. CBS 134916]
MVSKYQNGHRLFSSPYASLSPPTTDFSSAMSRSSSHDSTSSVSHYQFDTLPAYRSAPMSRSTSAPTQLSSVAMRRSSSASSSQAAWIASPYRSCLTTSVDEPTSYISDDDLLYLPIPVQSIPTPERQPRGEMTTEEQIAHLRQLQEQEERLQSSRRSSSTHSKKQVRFDVGSPKARRSAQPKRRSTAARRSSGSANGPM